MKIQVVHRDGSHEVLTLTDPLTITRSDGHGARITTATGMDHFFNEDGTYDGWGRAVSIPIPAEQMSGDMPKDAKDFIQQIDSGREFPEEKL